MAPAKNSHHHGNLRKALIDAGVELLREGGPDALSIRKAAARAGVSHAAPAHHFARLEDFKFAVIAQGFREFARSMENEIENLTASQSLDPRSRILAACRGYIRFAQKNPSMFQLMFSGSGSQFDNDELDQAAAAAYTVLARISAAVVPGPTGPMGVEAFIWSLVHGFASLSLANRMGFETDEQAIRQFEALFPDLTYRNVPGDGNK